MKQKELKLKAPLLKIKDSSYAVMPFIGHGTRLQVRGVENPVRAFDSGVWLFRKSSSLFGSDGQRNDVYAKPHPFEPLAFQTSCGEIGISE